MLKMHLKNAFQVHLKNAIKNAFKKSYYTDFTGYAVFLNSFVIRRDSLYGESLYREAITWERMGKKTGPKVCVRYRENSLNGESL